MWPDPVGTVRPPAHAGRLYLHPLPGMAGVLLSASSSGGGADQTAGALLPSHLGPSGLPQTAGRRPQNSRAWPVLYVASRRVAPGQHGTFSSSRGRAHSTNGGSNLLIGKTESARGFHSYGAFAGQIRFSDPRTVAADKRASRCPPGIRETRAIRGVDATQGLGLWAPMGRQSGRIRRAARIPGVRGGLGGPSAQSSVLRGGLIAFAASAVWRARAVFPHRGYSWFVTASPST